MDSTTVVLLKKLFVSRFVLLKKTVRVKCVT